MKEIFLFTCVLIVFAMTISGQENSKNESLDEQKSIIHGIQAGAGWAFEDKAHLFNSTISISTDFHLKNNYYIQFAPQYSWLWKWNEHYLTLPIHLRKKIGEKISVFAGPCLTFEVDNFNDIGLSGGMYYHINRKSALRVSAFSFTLYDYNIDYLYVPVSLAYRYSFR